MTLVAAALSMAAAAVAALCGAAEGALLAKPARDGHAPVDTSQLDLDHRALAIGRRLAQLASAAAAAVALGLGGEGGWAASAGVLAIAILLGGITEVGARMVGDARGVEGLGSLRYVLRVMRVLMSPAVALGRRVEGVLLRRFPAEAPDEAARESSQEQFREVMAGGL